MMLATIRLREGVHLPEGDQKKEGKHDLLGWLLFVVSATFFIAASIRAGDVIGLLGGIFFLLACVAFLVPYAGRRGR